MDIKSKLLLQIKNNSKKRALSINFESARFHFSGGVNRKSKLPFGVSKQVSRTWAYNFIFLNALSLSEGKNLLFSRNVSIATIISALSFGDSVCIEPSDCPSAKRAVRRGDTVFIAVIISL